MSPARAPLVRHFSKLKDPRRKGHNKKKHKLLDIVVIAICSALCGIDEFEHMEMWGKARTDWLKQFLELPYGIPSHDTFRRLFARINPKMFEQCFLSWMAEVTTLCPGEVVAIDGKTLRRSFDRASSKGALHLVSAWATANGVVLGQVAVAEKSNEITAIPQLLAALDLKGCLITIDAMGTQREIAAQIIAAEADYTLALKGNQKTLHEDVVAAFSKVDLKELEGDDRLMTHEAAHGRVDVRQYFVINDVRDLQLKHKWPGLASIGLVRSLRVTDDTTSTECRYYINSYASDAVKFAHAAREHWGVENRLHWQLDVSLFAEDRSRVRKDNAPENLAVLRHVALNLHKRDPEKGSMKTKKMRCTYDPDHIFKILNMA
jgi:predicted transposase YbfD/YdcC